MNIIFPQNVFFKHSNKKEKKRHKCMTNRKQASPELWPKKQATKEKQGDSKKPKYKKIHEKT